MEETWNNIKETLRAKLSTHVFQTFVSSASPVSLSDNVLTLKVPNPFSKNWVKDKCEPLIFKYTPDLSDSFMIEYLIHEEPSKAEKEGEQLQMFDKASQKEATTTQAMPKYVFENFIIGQNNRFAYASCEAVSNSPAKAYNPLFIYGSAGLGKTHLLKALSHNVSIRFPKMKIMMVSCEKFTNELINSIKNRAVEKFRARFRTVDVLIVDDIQFLAGKEQTQEEFFHTFNDLHAVDRQIVLSSDRSPKEIPTLEDRLRTRFEWGLIADIQPPELETRIAILRKKIEQNNFLISDEILHFIATQITTNVREMEGALTRIVAYASLLDTEVTLSIASNVIKDMVGIKQEAPLSIDAIIKKVSDYFNLSTSDIRSKNRSKTIAFARQMGMYLSRELTNISLPKIGEAFGNRDHSTIMHGCEKIKSLMKTDNETKNIVNILISQIKSENDC